MSIDEKIVTFCGIVDAACRNDSRYRNNAVGISLLNMYYARHADSLPCRKMRGTVVLKSFEELSNAVRQECVCTEIHRILTQFYAESELFESAFENLAAAVLEPSLKQNVQHAVQTLSYVTIENAVFRDMSALRRLDAIYAEFLLLETKLAALGTHNFYVGGKASDVSQYSVVSPKRSDDAAYLKEFFVFSNGRIVAPNTRKPFVIDRDTAVRVMGKFGGRNRG